jgi:protein transport protein SEC23
VPAELLPQCSTIEYTLSAPHEPRISPVFLFVVDVCLIEKELQAVKDAVLMSFSLLPEDALVGLITCGTTVNLYDLAFTELPKSYVFRGDRDVQPSVLRSLLGIATADGAAAGGAGGAAPAAAAAAGAAGAAPQMRDCRFLRPLSECEFQLTSILEELQRDPYPVKSGCRPLRSTGVALSVATGLLESVRAGAAARVQLFLGGPAVQGPGATASQSLGEPMRSHQDIAKDRTPLMAAAEKHYDGIAARLVAAGHACDMFIGALDQCGIVEMRQLVLRTGGTFVNVEIFECDQFRESYRRSLARSKRHGGLAFASNGTLRVRVSRELRVAGLIGHAASLGESEPNVSENDVGVGQTCAWKLCGVEPTSTYAIYFDVVNAHANPIPPQQLGMVQYQTTYINGLGQRILRITTTARAWADPSSGLPPLAIAFDQETSAIAVARLAAWRAQRENPFDVMRWLDRALIKLVSKFASFTPNDAASFQLQPQFALYPQFLFHLRRSPFLQTFNASPDETVFFRYMLLKETVGNSLIMIQPTLDAYSFAGPPQPVLLSAKSVLPDRILLLDTFFQVLVFYGETIDAWKKAKYDEQPEHENFRQLLAAPVADAKALLAERYPAARFVECAQHTSQARFLLATIDPAITPQNMSGGGAQGEVVFSEDVDYATFQSHLIAHAVAAAK